ncbi:MAG: M50 family metallopeptidase [Bacteroidales bacterium]|nr:M50 family metallopeptidase [Bacteroidales bacterium]
MEQIAFWGIPLIYWLLVAAFVLPKIPYVGKFFNVINTGIHELGHALMALILQGQVLKIELFGDTSGSAVTKSANRFTAVLVSLSGYLFASAVAYFAFYLINIGYVNHFIIGLSLVFLLMLILWVRNWFGVIWVLLFVALNAFLIYHGNELYINIAALFYAVMILIESVWSTLVVLFISVVNPESAGDAANLQKQTHVPAFIWALLFVAFAGFIAYKVVVGYLLPMF